MSMASNLLFKRSNYKVTFQPNNVLFLLCFIIQLGNYSLRATNNTINNNCSLNFPSFSPKYISSLFTVQKWQKLDLPQPFNTPVNLRNQKLQQKFIFYVSYVSNKHCRHFCSSNGFISNILKYITIQVLKHNIICGSILNYF